MWEAPSFTGGNGLTIDRYRIRILTAGYSAMEDSAMLMHTITADGDNIMFNVEYIVQLTAENTQGESIIQEIAISIPGSCQ